MQPASSFQEWLHTWLPHISTENYHVLNTHILSTAFPVPFLFPVLISACVETVTLCSSAHDRTVGHAFCSHNTAFLRQVRQEPIQHYPEVSGSLCAQRFQRQRATPLTCTTLFNNLTQLSPSLGSCNQDQPSSRVQYQLQRVL